MPQNPKSPDRIERVLSLLQEAWSLCPELRLGQFLVNLSPQAEANLFNLQDTSLEVALRTFIDYKTFNGK